MVPDRTMSVCVVCDRAIITYTLWGTQGWFHVARQTPGPSAHKAEAKRFSHAQ